jgi:succinate dehydrogenase/fumarate reductase flavoprotein subunit
MAWILLDARCKRFMSEYQPYTQDTGMRPMQCYDPETQRFPRNPAFMICDDEGHRIYPLDNAMSNDQCIRYDWSDDNSAEVDNGFIRRAGTLDALANMLGLDAQSLQASVAHWNEQCKRGEDTDFGGPVHDAQSRVIDVYGQPIPRLYTAGELGGAFGPLYISGGNIAECVVTGRIAGTSVTNLSSWVHTN